MVERLTGGPTFGVLFPMIVHGGHHYECLARSEEPKISESTSVFVSSATSTDQTQYVVDVVQDSHLTESVQTIENTFEIMSNQIGRWLISKGG